MLTTFNRSSLNYKRLTDLAPLLIDDETGIISYIQELPRQADMPDFIYYKAEIADTGVFGLNENRPTGGGTSLDRDKAFAKALGEAVERYSSAVYFPDQLVLSSYRELTRDAVQPQRFAMHTKEQLQHKHFPLERFDEDTPIRWLPAKHLLSGNDVLVPAALAYCPYHPDRNTGEAEIAESVSTGLAAHCSFEEAAINGILEAVERDSFMLRWYARAACAVVAQESMSSLHREMIRRFEMHGYTIRILNATSDSGIPTVIAMMHGDRTGSVPLVIAAATHMDPAVAVSKSIEELALMERLCKRVLLTLRSWPEEDQYDDMHTLADHLKCWLNPRIIPSANFLVSDREHISMDQMTNLSTGRPESDLRALAQRIEDTGHQVYIADVTTSDISSLGLHVVRALIPGYVPLTIDYHCRPEGSQRLHNVIQQSAAMNNGAQVINPLPHPFA